MNKVMFICEKCVCVYYFARYSCTTYIKHYKRNIRSSFSPDSKAGQSTRHCTWTSPGVLFVVESVVQSRFVVDVGLAKYWQSLFSWARVWSPSSRRFAGLAKYYLGAWNNNSVVKNLVSSHKHSIMASATVHLKNKFCSSSALQWLLKTFSRPLISEHWSDWTRMKESQKEHQRQRGRIGDGQEKEKA